MPAPPGNPSEPLLDGVTAAVPSPEDDMPDSDRHPPHSHAIGELGDRDLARIVLARAFMGLPLVFIVSTALRLARRPGHAVAISVLPTLFSGSFVGGLIL